MSSPKASPTLKAEAEAASAPGNITENSPRAQSDNIGNSKATHLLGNGEDLPNGEVEFPAAKRDGKVVADPTTVETVANHVKTFDGHSKQSDFP
jgi:hypothetical protein